MSKQKVKPVFQSADNKTHETAEAAEKWNAILAACQQLHDAGRVATRLLAESARTADGEPFDFSHSRTYYRIAQYSEGLPRMVEVWVWPHHVEIDVDRDTARLVIREWDPSRQCKFELVISELYAHKKNAINASIVMAEEQMKAFSARLGRMRAGKDQ